MPYVERVSSSWSPLQRPNNPVLFWPVYNYLIIYKQDTNPLEIVRVLNGYRNLIDLLH